MVIVPHYPTNMQLYLTNMSGWYYKTATNQFATPQGAIQKMKSDGTLTNAITILLATGEICKVRGHVDRPVIVETNANAVRVIWQCELCGREQK